MKHQVWILRDAQGNIVDWSFHKKLVRQAAIEHAIEGYSYNMKEVESNVHDFIRQGYKVIDKALGIDGKKGTLPK